MAPGSWNDPRVVRTLGTRGRRVGTGRDPDHAAPGRARPHRAAPPPKGTTMTTTSSLSRLLRRLDGYTLWAFNADTALGGRRTGR